jgi:hypothetical protein
MLAARALLLALSMLILACAREAALDTGRIDTGPGGVAG